ncbi:MAG: copper chaperone PCu(A)C [Anaerolineales bacterium]|nr:copper chaperone PCu(A)C [Anaerolineales bacterium]
MRYFLIIIVLLLSACSSLSGELTVNNAWSRPALKSENGAVYFVIENGTYSNEKLLSVSTDVAEDAQIHMTMVNDQSVMSMKMQEFVEIPSGNEINFKSGGLHIMLANLHQDLLVGDTFTLTLQFENAGEVNIQVIVKEY